MAGAYSLLFAAMMGFIAGVYMIWFEGPIGGVFVAFGLILFMLGMRQMIAIKRKGESDA
jgi:hypothetical protein